MSLDITSVLKHHKIPAVSIAIVQNNEPVHFKCEGSDEHTLFQVASLSKTLNAVGALLLVEQGKLSLDDDANKFLRSWKVPENEWTQTEKVTLRGLLSHTAGTNVSGFPGYHSDLPVPNTVQILNGEQPLANTEAVEVIVKPGDAYLYSGGGSTIVQCMIEDVTNENYSSWMQRHVLMPLGMTSSIFEQPSETGNIAYAYDENGQLIDGKWHIYPELAAAGLWTNGVDMASMIQRIINMFHDQPGEVLRPATFRDMIAPQALSIVPDSYVGLGLYLYRSEDKFYLRNTGGNFGYSCVFAIYPGQKSGFAILTNRDDAFTAIDHISEIITSTYNFPTANFVD